MSNATIEQQTLLTAQLVFSDAEALVPKIAATVNDEVSRHHEVIAGELKTVGAAAFMKLIPTHRNLHRHVAVLLPEYDAAYRYKRRATAWETEGRPARPKRRDGRGCGRGSAFIQAHGGSAVWPRPPRLPGHTQRFPLRRDSSSTLSGPDGFSWKTSRTPDAENDPRFPDFW